MGIDIFADVVCPWCYIGEARLERALTARPELQAAWRWRPFQLQPGIPAAGLPWAEFAGRKFGGMARAQAAFAHVVQAGAEDGLQFDFSRVATAPNTADAHRLILLAQESGRAREMANALFEAYFAQGANLNDHDQLVAFAGSAGLDPDTARDRLQSDTGKAEVRQSQLEAQQLGINGVPFFVFNGKYGVSGVQPVERFAAILDRLVEVDAA